MRILHISSARLFSGTERHFVDLARALAARGHEVFAAVRPRCTWKERLHFLPPEKMFQVSIRNSFGVLSAMRVADFVRENEIEIVHAHVARDYIPASIACLASPAKFVLTRHVLPPLKPFNRFALKNLERAIAVSDAVAVSLKTTFTNDKISVIYNGLDTSARRIDDREKLGQEFRFLHNIPFDVPLVGTLGELKEQKGQREFVLAAAEMAKMVPECRFAVVGVDNTIEKKFRRELKRLVSVFEMEDRFLWLDWLEDTRPFFAATDVFVSPSRSESFGLAILEAMASGTPVVATETDGAKQLLGINGCLAGVEDPVGITRCVTTMLEDANTRERVAAENAKRAAAMFDLTRMIDETERLYEAVLEKRR